MNKISRRTSYISSWPAGCFYLPGSAVSWYPVLGRSGAAKPLWQLRSNDPILNLDMGGLPGTWRESQRGSEGIDSFTKSPYHRQSGLALNLGHMGEESKWLLFYAVASELKKFIIPSGSSNGKRK